MTSSNSEQKDNMCFHSPGYPFSARRHKNIGVDDPSRPPICVNVSPEHLKQVKGICEVYSKCELGFCKQFLEHRPAMCAPISTRIPDCMYEWAKLYQTTNDDSFVKEGQMFIKNIGPDVTVEKCRVAGTEPLRGILKPPSSH